MRLSEKPFDYIEKIRSEVDWVYYLVHKGVSASLPIKTIEGELTAFYREKDKCFILTSFQMALGRFFDKSDPLLWGPDIYRKWGETVGRMHYLSKSDYHCVSSAKRDDWSKSKIDNPFLLQGRYGILVDKLKSIEEIIDSFPRNKHSYGLIQNDFHL